MGFLHFVRKSRLMSLGLTPLGATALTPILVGNPAYYEDKKKN